MGAVIRSVAWLVVTLVLSGCVWPELGDNMLYYSVKDNSAACSAGYREACLHLYDSGCSAGAGGITQYVPGPLSACRAAVNAQVDASTELHAMCDKGGKGACYTLASVACRKGDDASCDAVKKTESATLDAACKSGDALACANPPPGVKADAAVVINNP